MGWLRNLFAKPPEPNLFNVIRYPIPAVITAEFLSSLPPPVLKKWHERMCRHSHKMYITGGDPFSMALLFSWHPELDIKNKSSQRELYDGWLREELLRHNEP